MKNMLTQLTNRSLKLLSGALLFVGVLTVNSSCNAVFYQPEEKNSLKRFKK